MSKQYKCIILLEPRKQMMSLRDYLKENKLWRKKIQELFDECQDDTLSCCYFDSGLVCYTHSLQTFEFLINHHAICCQPMDKD